MILEIVDLEKEMIQEVEISLEEEMRKQFPSKMIPDERILNSLNMTALLQDLLIVTLKIETVEMHNRGLMIDMIEETIEELVLE